ncbi:MAG: SIR2 family protein [Minicystis sp.]
MNNRFSLRDLAQSLDDAEVARLKDTFSDEIAKVQDERLLGIARSFREQGIALVLGAGVSMSANAPGWGQLMGRLVLSVVHSSLEPGTAVDDAYLPFTEIFAQTLPKDQLVAAQYVKLALESRGLKDEHVFLRTLRQVLYAGTQDPASSALIVSLADLCRGSGWQRSAGVREVITYNYDVFLEELLARVNCPYQTVPRHQRAEGDRLPVYHPHGILHRTENPNDWAILSEDDYHSEFAAPHSWSNIVQLNAFSQMRCVFIGLSLTDPNIRRLLGAARTKGTPQHFAFLRRRDPNAVLESLEQERGWGSAEPRGRLRDALAERVRVGCLGGDVADNLTLEALGVQVIWYDHHGDLSMLINDLLK